MPIYSKDSQNLVHIHVPKCGGTSVFKTLGRLGWSASLDDQRPDSELPYKAIRRLPPQHLPVSSIDALFDVSKADSCFALVRHPYDRVVSAYNFYCRHNGFSGSRSDYVKRRLHIWRPKPTEPLNDWLKLNLSASKVDPYHLNGHLTPGTWFCDDRVAVFRIEDQLESLVAHLAQFEPKLSSLVRVNRSRPSSTAFQQLSEDNKHRIEQVFKHDFDLWYPNG